MPITDGLDYAKRLEAVGFTHEQAHSLADMLEETAQVARPDLSHLATKEDLRVMGEELRSEFRTELQRELRSIQRELRQQMLWFFAMLVGVAMATLALARWLW